MAATERKFGETFAPTRPESISRATLRAKGQDFFTPIGRNPLKSPDSEK
jgi:hypothetical protein